MHRTGQDYSVILLNAYLVQPMTVEAHEATTK
jgi:hypothetical protein